MTILSSMLENLTLLTKPNINELYSKLINDLSHNRCIILLSECEVYYEGRARSILTRGVALIIVKRDKASIIHQSKGYTPVNWQPAGSIIHVEKEKDKIILRVIRQKPKEILWIPLYKTYVYLSYTPKIEGEFQMHLTEKEMQKILRERPELIEKELEIISFEKKVEPGFVDLYAKDKKGNLVIIELKRTTASTQAVLQLAKYIDSLKKHGHKNVRGILVAPNITKKAYTLLRTLGLEYKKISLKELSKRLKQILEAKTYTIEEYLR